MHFKCIILNKFPFQFFTFQSKEYDFDFCSFVTCILNDWKSSGVQQIESNSVAFVLNKERKMFRIRNVNKFMKNEAKVWCVHSCMFGVDSSTMFNVQNVIDIFNSTKTKRVKHQFTNI